ncbi:GGDEF domain-containing protein [Sphingobacterium multivorum]|uniref:diguanylate cyclase n=1 Tax=Sphingobacterium multivorum TaxID=28454 RepID=A0ABX7CW82_SPHMU|nr:GGDEF domain-containing protein [Sphingobacterium multivorum]QQT55334.1 GGDEF domain-containing protein [Sphingobacterium multivorum]
MGYIYKSLRKFKDDFLSKGIYDFLKWSVLTLLLIFTAKWIPPINQILMSKYSISIVWLLISSILLIILTTVVVRIIYKKLIKEIVNDNFTDELTGLKNHKALESYLNQKIVESKKKSEPLSIILMDIDNFKNVNTEIGFNKADQLLKKIGELLMNDKRATDETFRYFNRGDEFLVVASETSLSQIYQASERKRKMIQKNLFSIEGSNYKLTVSCGVTELKKEDDFLLFTNRAIEALKEAKLTTGKNNTKSIV